MTWGKGELTIALEQAIHLLAEKKGTKSAATIRPIIFTNLNRNRVHWYLDDHPNSDPRDYVWRVADYYEQWHPHIYKVQVEKCSEVWEALYAQMQKWAYNYLRSKRFLNGGGGFRYSVDCAAEASGVLVAARFPYDVSFDPWACVLQQNVCRQYIARTLNPISIACEEVIALDAWDDWLWNLPDPSSIREKRRVELRLDLLDAIEQLSSDARKQFVLLHYFEQNTFKQIAEKMHRSTNTLYKLHFDALENLKRVLENMWSS